MNDNVVAFIRQDPTYKKMTSDDVLGRIINHEMYIEEANHIKNLYNDVTTTKKQEIALKASKIIRIRTCKWWLRAQVKKKKKRIVPNVMPKRWLSS
jgi:hypothetical protein